MKIGGDLGCSGRWLWFYMYYGHIASNFNNISVILWYSDLFVEETGVPEENYWPVTSTANLQVNDKFDHMKLYLIHLTIESNSRP